MKTGVGRRALAAVATLSLLAAACGDDDESTASTSSAQDTSTVETTEATAGTEATSATTGASEEPAGTADPASGEPVKIMQILESGGPTAVPYDSYIQGLAIRIERLNNEGGLAGHPVEVEVCETKLDPNLASECARKAADDPAFVAVVGSVSQFGDAFIPLLEEAEIPYIGQFPFTPSDGTSAMSFPTHVGGAGALAGVVQYATQELGATKIAVGQLGVPGGDAAYSYIESVAGAVGAEASRVIIPPDRQDLSADVATMASQGDVIIPASTPEQTLAMVRSANQQGLDQPVLATFAAVPPRLLESLGDASEGLQMIALYNADPASDGAKQLFADADAAGEQVTFPDDELTTGYVGGWLFAEAAAKAETADRAGVLAALNAISAFDTGGLTPVLDFTKPGNALGGTQPRIVNTHVWRVKVENGLVVPNGAESINVFP